jgi:hypothetical protein
MLCNILRVTPQSTNARKRETPTTIKKTIIDHSFSYQVN